MAKEAIKKSLRFEVFKRDGFTCQYCGRSAPEVVLHADHVIPVAEGGETDLLNLVTSCVDCNLGKGPRKLSDDSALEKQRRQLQELNERRLQMEEMIKWREDLRAIQEDALDRVVSYFEAWINPIGISDHGKNSLRKLIKKYSIDEVLACIDIAAETYIRHGDDGPEKESVETAFKRLPGILFNRANPGRARYSQDAYYVRGILRNRVYVNEKLIMPLLSDAEERGVDMESLKDFAKSVRNWTQFREAVEQFIEENDVKD